MSHQRQAQWTHRLQPLQGQRDQLASTGQYDRAYKAHLAVQHVYERWADEVFAATRMGA